MKKINPKILDIIKRTKLNKYHSLHYLFDLMINMTNPDDFYDVLMCQTLNAQGIYKYEGVPGHRKIVWVLDLFGHDVEDAWDWVKTEYVPLFKAANREKGGHVKESTARMKKLFSEYPEIRKDDVLAAVRLYISEKDSRFIREPHYFIEKGVGAAKIQDILDYLDRVKENENVEGRTSPTITINE